jgi:hypothetical protein
VSRRPAAALAGLVLCLGTLSGCGGEPSVEDYCEQLQGERERIAEMVSSNDPGSLLGENLELFEDLGAQSPRDLQGEWDTLLGALRALDDALTDAGVEADDFADGAPPEGLDDDQVAAVEEAVRRVQSEDVVSAASGIETQARDVCKVNLGL